MITEKDRLDLLTDYLAQMEETACELVALVKERQTTTETVIYVDTDGNDAVAKVYDYRSYEWKSKDTLDKLAYDFMGNADYGTLIAYYNRIQNESEIEAGTRIKIPILSETTGSRGNRIYAVPEKWSNYGTDIAIDDNGDFAISGQDARTVTEVENLAQAIANRLETASARRIRLTAYGIRSNIGDPVAVESYLTSTIEQTIKADPRIREVNEITFYGDGDTLNLEVSYTDINGNEGNYKGEL